MGGVILLGLARRGDSSYINVTWCNTKSEIFHHFLRANSNYQNSFLSRPEAFIIPESENLSRLEARAPFVNNRAVTPAGNSDICCRAIVTVMTKHNMKLPGPSCLSNKSTLFNSYLYDSLTNYFQRHSANFPVLR